MKPFNIIKDVGNPQADKAILAVKSALDLNVASKLTTNIGSDLFQSVVNACQISRFVSGVLADQTTDALAQINWHFVYSAADFNDHLKSQLTTNLFNSLIDFQRGNLLNLTDFKIELQSEASIMSVLRKIRYQHSCAIAVLELNNIISIEESSARMSILAEQLTCIAYLWSYTTCRHVSGTPVGIDNQSQPQNMLILAMGKFGGCELNFSSDIDLIFFYVNDGQTSGGRRQIGNSRFFQKVGVLLIKILDEVTEDGFVFRVDMRLRPYGDAGNLVMSVPQAEDYYHEQGRGWERFAMVRSRIISGRADEAKQLQDIITPFAFRRYIDYGVIDSLRNMKAMIQREVRRRGLTGNIKLGAGGIREIEFMVQSLQLIQGGRDKRLQEKNILKVLPLLADEELLPIETAKELKENYRFLRRLEHCIQELDEKQTQQLPEDSRNKQIIAEVMGFSDWTEFKQQLLARLSNTNQHFNALFGEDQTRLEHLDDFYLSLWEAHISSEELRRKHTQFSQADAEEFILILNAFKNASLLVNLSAKGVRRLNSFFPSLLEICLKVKTPVKSLSNILVILKSILKRTAYLELLSENLPVLQHLVDLTTRSNWIVERLSECPILFDELLYPNSLYQPLQSVDLQSELRQNLLRIENDEESILDAIRIFKQTNELRVAAALISERLNMSQVSDYLTQLAEVIIQTALSYCWSAMVSKHGQPEFLQVENDLSISESATNKYGFVVVGYGKLGGYELGFNSDLDLVFIYDQPLDSETTGINDNRDKSINISRFYTRLAQKLIHFLSTRMSLGLLYEVDMRLRPSGNSGLLVSHVNAFSDYQNENAWTWEHQALIRSRVVAGDRKLADKHFLIRQEVLTKKRDPIALKKDVAKMRETMRVEIEQKHPQINGEAFIDLKQCVGGLVDIEFIAQYLVLNISLSKTKKNLDDEFSSNELGNEAQAIPNSTIDTLKFVERNRQISKADSLMLIKTFRSYQNLLNEKALLGGDKNAVSNKILSKERASIIKIWNKLLGSKLSFEP